MRISEITKSYPDKNKFLSLLYSYYKTYGEIDKQKKMERFAIKYRDYVLKGSEVNTLAKKIKKEVKDDLWLLDVTFEMWKRNKGSDRFLCPKIMGRSVKNFPEESKKNILKMKELIEDWADCDGLVAHAYSPYAKKHVEDVFRESKKCITSKNKWVRRFAIVSFIPLIHSKDFKDYQKILSVLDKLMQDDEKYVKKAISWVLKEIGKKDFNILFSYLKEKAVTENKNQKWIVRNAVEYFSKEDKEKIRTLINKA